MFVLLITKQVKPNPRRGQAPIVEAANVTAAVGVDRCRESKVRIFPIFFDA
jgi:hypothetical protein